MLDMAVDLICNLADIAMIAVFCRSLPSGDAARWKKGACIALLAAMQLVCYALELDMYLNTRMVLRILSAVIYIAVFKDCRLKLAAYAAVLLSVCVTGCHNIFLAPYLRDYRLGRFEVIASPVLNEAFCQLSVLCFDLAVVWLAGRLIDLGHAVSGSRTRIAIGLSLLVVELYVKYMLKLYADSGEHSTDIMLFSIIVSVLAIALVIVYENFLAAREAQLRQERIDAARRYGYESALSAAQADMSVRRLHHDMKNHVTALLSLCGSDEKLRSYLMSMSEGLERYDAVVKTGSAVLDGLLGEKMSRARELGVRMTVCVDFTGGDFIDDIDVCAIFGNLTDNALRAAAGLPDGEERAVYLRAARLEGNMVIKCANRYSGGLRWKNGLPLTDRDGERHGIGLQSVRQSAERYGGAVDITAEDGMFTASVIIPENTEKADA